MLIFPSRKHGKTMMKINCANSKNPWELWDAAPNPARCRQRDHATSFGSSTPFAWARPPLQPRHRMTSFCASLVPWHKNSPDQWSLSAESELSISRVKLTCSVAKTWMTLACCSLLGKNFCPAVNLLSGIDLHYHQRKQMMFLLTLVICITVGLRELSTFAQQSLDICLIKQCSF